MSGAGFRVPSVSDRQAQALPTAGKALVTDEKVLDLHILPDSVVKPESDQPHVAEVDIGEGDVAQFRTREGDARQVAIDKGHILPIAVDYSDVLELVVLEVDLGEDGMDVSDGGRFAVPAISQTRALQLSKVLT